MDPGGTIWKALSGMLRAVALADHREARGEASQDAEEGEGRGTSRCFRWARYSALSVLSGAGGAGWLTDLTMPLPRAGADSHTAAKFATRLSQTSKGGQEMDKAPHLRVSGAGDEKLLDGMPCLSLTR